MQETGCPPTASKSKLRFESVAFADIPGQSKLFLQYQTHPETLKDYYPSAVASHVDVAERTSEVLASYVVDREKLCDILDTQNRKFGADAKTLDNIALLRRTDTVAVLTGQQAGLFTGPLYTLYKALSAVKMVECLRGRGLNAVPVFWAATEDHDFEEISRTTFLDSSGDPVRIDLGRDDGWEGSPVGGIPIPDSFAKKLHEGLAALPSTEFSDALRDSLSAEWKSGRTVGDAFCTNLQDILRGLGVIVVDPLDAGLKELVAPIYSQAAAHSDEIVAALVERSSRLKTDAYEPQVLVTPDYFPLFYHTDDGVRSSVRRTNAGKYRVAETKLEFSLKELADLAANEPSRFSPGVMLRPVVQDYLFPTACYFGGGAEISYFAQNSEVYRILERPATTILHRQSFTVIEAKHARTLEKYGLEFVDLFEGLEALLPGIVEKYVNPSSSRLFADAEENINVQLHRLDQDLSKIDPTLAANLATRRRKILYHIAALQKKFHRVQIQRDEILSRRLNALFSSLLPERALQERSLNVATFTSRYGPNFVDWIYDSIDLEERGHRLLYL